MVNQHLDFMSLLKRCVRLKLPDFSIMKMDIQTNISTFEVTKNRLKLSDFSVLKMDIQIFLHLKLIFVHHKQ